MQESLRIHRLRIVSYRGVQSLDMAIPPAGAIFAGGNMQGKTSVLAGIEAALLARDISPDAIRHGHERAEVMVDLGHVTVQRVITSDGETSLSMKEDGKAVRAPAKRLAELLGTAMLNPLDLYFERDPVKRRKIILKALPMKLTPELLREWIPKEQHHLLPHVEGKALEVHGLEGLTMVRAFFYDSRGECNRRVKEQAGVVEATDAELAKLAGKVTRADVGTIEEATARWAGASHGAADVKARFDLATQAMGREKRLREEIAERRAKGDALEAEGAALHVAIDAELPALIEARKIAGDAVQVARAAFEAAERAFIASDQACKACEEKGQRAHALKTEAAEQHRQAASLEDALPPAGAAPTEEDVRVADRAVAEAEAMIDEAKTLAAVKVLRVKLEKEREAQRQAETDAGKLTAVVDTLTHAAPAALIARSRGIPGLGIDSDGGITMNGTSMDALSGREQLIFAVDLARRLNAKAKILVVDALERIEPAYMRTFVEEATRDGFQLIATRVQDGDVVLEAIELGDAAAASAAEGG